MKNPFNILYYTGLTILISLSLIVGLFTFNLQNILKLFPNKKDTTVESAPKGNTYVLENLQPIKQEVSQAPKQETTKPKDKPVNNNRIIAKDTNETKPEPILVEEKKEPEDSNDVKIP